MEVSDDEVRHVASLARLAIPEAALPQVAGELRGILAHMRQLREFSAAAPAVEDTAAPAAPLRTDEPRPESALMAIGAFAPAVRDGFFVVPQVVAHAPAVGTLGARGAVQPGPATGADEDA